MMIQIESFPPSLPNFLLLSKSQTKVKVRGVLTLCLPSMIIGRFIAFFQALKI